MPDFYRLVTSDPNDGTTGVVLEKDDDGQPTKVVSTGIPVQLNAEDRKKVESLGYTLDSVSKEEAEEAAKRGAVGGDVAGAAPVLGGSAASKDKDE